MERGKEVEGMETGDRKRRERRRVNIMWDEKTGRRKLQAASHAKYFMKYF